MARKHVYTPGDEWYGLLLVILFFVMIIFGMWQCEQQTARLHEEQAEQEHIRTLVFDETMIKIHACGESGHITSRMMHLFENWAEECRRSGMHDEVCQSRRDTIALACVK